MITEKFARDALRYGTILSTTNAIDRDGNHIRADDVLYTDQTTNHDYDLTIIRRNGQIIKIYTHNEMTIG